MSTASQMANSRAFLSIPRRAKEILFLLVAFFIALLVVRFSRSMLWPSLSPRQPAFYKYGIVFDAGSTGTRINIFKLKKENAGQFLHQYLFVLLKLGIYNLF
jgi:hypothetical protein